MPVFFGKYMNRRKEIYEKLADYMPDGFAYHRIVTGADGKPRDYVFLEVNPAFEQLTGLTRNQVIGKGVTEVLPSIVYASFDWIGTYGKIALEGGSAHFEHYSEPLGRWYEVTAYCDRPGFFATVFRDITARKNEEEILTTLSLLTDEFLEQSGEEIDYRKITETVRHFTGAKYVACNIYEEDGEHFTTMALAGVREHLGRASALLGFNPVGRRWGPDTRREGKIRRQVITSFPNLRHLVGGVLPGSVVALIEKVFLTGEVLVVRIERRQKKIGDFTLIMPRGKKYTNLSLLEIYAHQVGLLLTRKRAEEVLRESEEYFKILFEHSSVALFIHDKNTGNFLDANRKALEIYGYTHVDELRNGPFWLDSPYSFKEAKQLIHKAGKEGPQHFEWLCRKKSGEVFWQEIHLSKITRGKEEYVLAAGIDITERKKVEAALQENEERFRTLFETMAQGVVYQDAKGKIVDANMAAERILGLTLDQMRGKTFLEPRLRAIREDGTDFPADEHPSLISLQTGKPVTGVLMGIYHPTAEEYRWIIVHAVPQCKPGQSKPFQVYITFTDITRQRQAEIELSKQRNFLETIISTVIDPVCVVDANDRFILNNRAHLRLLGVSTQEEARGKTVYDFFPPEDAGDFMKTNRQVWETGKPLLNIEERVVDPRSGAIHWFLVSKTPLIHAASGEYEGLVAVLRDITDRKHAEEQLRRSEYEKSLILDASAELFSYIDRDLTIQWANRVAGEAAGEEARDLVGRRCFEVWHGRDRSCAGCPIVKARDSGKAAEGEIATPQGRIWHLRGYPVFNEAGEVAAVVEFGQDITERKQWEEKIHHLSFHDSLTDLYNRAYLEEEIHRLDTHRQLPISIIMCDVNGLKLVNDAYGHRLGDELLVRAAVILKKNCRKEDIVARWGGDEFVIFLPQTSLEETQAILERITGDCKKNTVGKIPLSMALGCACKEHPDQDIFMVFRDAEDRMYKNKLVESRSTRSALLSTLKETMREKSHDTEEHAERLQNIALIMGKALHLSQADIDRLVLLVSLHDIGKIIVPEEILNKKGLLNEEEWEVMKKHPETGYRIARSTDELAHIAEEILSHHEHWNGSGYPRGLREKNIPLLSRITAIIDACDAMTHFRTYKKTMNSEEALAELRRCSGYQFDPELVEVFCNLIEQKIIS